MTQWVGMSDRAKKYIKDNCKKDLIEVFKNGVLDKSYEMPVKELGDKIFGMFEEEIQLFNYMLDVQLFNYTFSDGSILKEIEQASPWASGPVIFTCLENEAGKRIGEWTDKEIDSML
jgi:hypothetical protein